MTIKYIYLKLTRVKRTAVRDNVIVSLVIKVEWMKCKSQRFFAKIVVTEYGMNTTALGGGKERESLAVLFVFVITIRFTRGYNATRS